MIFVTLNYLFHFKDMLKTRITTGLFVFLCVLSIQFRMGKAYAYFQPDERKAAIGWFESGQFEKALPVFAKLTYNFPYDFLLKYYFGASLVETGKNGLDAEKNLTLASTKEVPVKVFYYLARFYHAGSNWNNALRYYNRFKNSAESTEIQKLEINDLIELCYGKINPFVNEISKDQSSDENQGVEVGINNSLTDSIKLDYGQTSDQLKGKRESLDVQSHAVKTSANQSDSAIRVLSLKRNNETTENKIQLPVFINFQINSKITYLIEEMFHVTEAKVEFRTAAEKERLLDSLLQEVQHLRKLYHHSVNPVVRDSLATKIQTYEYRNLVLNTEVDQHYNQARKLEQGWWEKSDPSYFEDYTEMKDSLIRLQRAYLTQVQLPDSMNISSPDTLANDSLEVPDYEIKTSGYSDTEVVYKIQIGAFDKGIPVQRKILFDKLAKIRTIDTLEIENGVKVYTSGNLKNISDAMKMQAQIRQEGIKDAFVIAVKNGKRIPLSEINNKQEK
jgi:hypothetical protein